jgi:RNA polymerase sigma-70 factor (ECF subfamily)
LYGYFYRLTGNPELSDDLLSQLFVKLVTKIGSFRAGSFEGWLFKIASNLFNDHLRAKQREKKLLETRAKQLDLEPKGHTHYQDQQTDNLQIQLQKLDADTRELITLRFYSQLSFKELSKIRCEPIGTTLAKVHRGLKKLRKLMEE